MKKIYYIILAASCCALASCKENLAVSPSEGLVPVTISVNSPASKVDIAADGKVNWSAADRLSVFTDTDAEDAATNYEFSVDNLRDGNKTASFNGDVADNAARTAVYVVYPFNEAYSTESAQALPVSVPAVQAAGSDSEYALMTGKGAVAGNDFSGAEVAMKQLCWIYDVAIDNSARKNISAVCFEASSAVFAVAGSLDATADAPAVTASKYSKSVTMEYASAQSASNLSARFVLLPVECEATDFYIDIVYEDQSYERFTFSGKALDAKAGQRFTNAVKVGEGQTSSIPKGYRLVSAGANIATAISDAIKAGDDVVKLWLESSPSTSVEFKTTSRIFPTRSIYIKSDPANKKPTITIGAKAALSPKTGCNVETIHFENIIFKANDSGEDFIFIDTTQSGGADNVSIANLEIENCEFTNFKYSIVRTSSLSAGMKVDRIVFNNSIWTSKSTFDAARAWIHIVNNADKMREIKITNSTIIGCGCLLYTNMNSSSKVDIDYDFSNCTFGNTKNTSSSNNYLLSIVSGTLKGKVAVKENLFAGTHTLKSGVTSFMLLREGSLTNYTNTIADNYYTATWRGTWTIDLTSKNYLLDILTNQTEKDNAALVPGAAGGDFTVAAGSDVYVNQIGDPRWIK